MDFSNLTEENINQAIQFIEKNKVPPGYKSKTADLVVDGKPYPPKYVLVVAQKIADGSVIDVKDFHTRDAVDFLQERGYNIVKREKEPEMSDEEKFKCLLEYFVAHLEYCENERTDTKGYDTYIKNLVEVGSFKKSGKGYDGNAIQSQIQEWADYTIGSICINVNVNYGKYCTKQTYLNWKDTGLNVIVNLKENKIDSLQLHIYQKDGPRIDVGDPKTLEELGLYDELPPNESLKDFFKKFEKMYSDYLNKAKEEKMFERINKEREIILKKKNLILQGAPGTGKTYETATLALQILNEEESVFENRTKIMERYRKRVEEGRIAFVTFHQTMDYESFVEGLKAIPLKDEHEKNIGGVTYEPRPGIFKTICDSARTKKDESFSSCFDKYLESIKGFENKKVIPSSTGRSQIYVWYEGGSTIQVRSVNSTFKDPTHAPAPLNIDKIKNQADGDFDHGENNWPHYADAIIAAVQKEYAPKSEAEKVPYVLIIDEINRGNVSKIFGELITLLEPDKREGEINEVKAKLMYSGIEFTIPSNLYIIGTMNTTDRSVGAIDYAIRRRFAFKTLKAERSVVESESPDETKDEALKLFDAVKKFLDDNKVDMEIDDMMVGHSYFLAKDMDDLNMKWEYEILPLMQEYYKDGIIKTNPLTCSMADFISSVN